MKIEFELDSDKGRAVRHLESFTSYIKDKIISTETDCIFGIPMYTLSIPKLGGKDWGENIGSHDRRVFVMSRITKGGVYKVKIWGE